MNTISRVASNLSMGGGNQVQPADAPRVVVRNQVVSNRLETMQPPKAKKATGCCFYSLCSNNFVFFPLLLLMLVPVAFAFRAMLFAINMY